MTTLEHSQPTLFDETELPLMSSAAGSRARTLASLENGLALKVRALVSGSSTRASLASFDPATWSLRTSQRLLTGDWTPFSEALPRSGTMRSGSIYALPTWAPRTDASGCSSSPWPTVTLTGSDDNWATTAFSQTVPWATGSMALLFDSTTCAKWRLAVNETGSIGWAYLGIPERPIVSGTAATVEHGTWRRRTRLATGQRTRALGGVISHESCTQSSVDDLLAAFEYATTYDDARIGAVSPEGEALVVDWTRHGFARVAADDRTGGARRPAPLSGAVPAALGDGLSQAS